MTQSFDSESTSAPTITSSDDAYYHLLRVNRLSAWVGLAAFGLMAAAVIVWAVFGVIVFTVSGQAVIAEQDGLIALAPEDAARVQVGQRVVGCAAAGDGRVIAVEGTSARVQFELETNAPPVTCTVQIIIAEQRPLQRLLP